MNDLPEQDEEQEIPSPDPNVYQPDEEEYDELEIDRRIRRAKERISRLTIVGSPDIDIEGAWDGEGHPHGYAVNYKPLGACCLDTGCRVLSENECTSEGGKYIGNGTACIPNPCEPTPPTETGACCDEDGTCTITTEAECGGTYQGDGTVCDPNPCPTTPTGACCVGTDCSIQTESDCTGMGGTYQGDDTTCDPNPCLPCNGCGFDAFDGSGRKFLTKTVTRLTSYPVCCDEEGGTHDISLDISYGATITIDTSDCSQSTDVFDSSCLALDCDGISYPCTAGPISSPAYVVDSATHRTFEHLFNCGYAPTCPDAICHDHQEEELSNECFP